MSTSGEVLTFVKLNKGPHASAYLVHEYIYGPPRLIYGIEQAAWIHPMRGSPTQDQPPHILRHGAWQAMDATTYNIVAPPPCGQRLEKRS